MAGARPGTTRPNKNTAMGRGGGEREWGDQLTAFGCAVAFDGFGIGVERAADGARTNSRPSKPPEFGDWSIRVNVRETGDQIGMIYAHACHRGGGWDPDTGTDGRGGVRSPSRAFRGLS